MTHRTRSGAIALALTLTMSGCTFAPGVISPAGRPTTSLTNKATPKAGALTKAKTSAIKSINLLSKVGSIALKVRNNVKSKALPTASANQRRVSALPSTAWAWLFTSYRVQDTNSSPAGSATASSSFADPGLQPPIGQNTLVNDDGSTAEVVVVASESIQPANDGVAGDQVIAATASITLDASASETGTESVSDVTDASGSIKSGAIAYTPDASASAIGEPAESVSFTVPPDQVASGSTANFNCNLSYGNETDTGNLQESSSANGDVAASGDVSLPGGDDLRLTDVDHPDGSRDYSGVVSGQFGLKVTLKADGTGTGTLYDRDPSDPAAVAIGTITLNAAAGSTIAFNKDDGTPDTPVPFNFLK
jgi:hypothetical protein